MNSDHLVLEHTEPYSSDDHHKMSLYHLGTVVEVANSTPETRVSRLKKLKLNFLIYLTKLSAAQITLSQMVGWADA